MKCWLCHAYDLSTQHGDLGHLNVHKIHVRHVLHSARISVGNIQCGRKINKEKNKEVF